MKQLGIIIVFCVAIANLSFAHPNEITTNSFKGKVVDNKTFSSMAELTIWVNGKATQFTTDENGEFDITVIGSTVNIAFGNKRKPFHELAFPVDVKNENAMTFMIELPQ